MFGSTIDYWLLRPLAHSRKRATEAQLDEMGGSSLAPGDAEAKLPRVLNRFEGNLPVSKRLSYLDMGCGSGELTLGLVRAGVTNIVGVDFLPRAIEQARRNAKEGGLDDRVRFECADLRTWTPIDKFDVVFSFDAFEHIGNPEAFLRRMQDFVAPGGVAVISFGPTFHSPFGDHMAEFFRVQIPWRGALFSEAALLRLRREFYRPTDSATRLEDIAGGLNRMKYSEFLSHVRRAGWRFRFLKTNTFLRNGALRAVTDVVSRVPVLRDYAAHNVYAVLEPTEAARHANLVGKRLCRASQRLAA